MSEKSAIKPPEAIMLLSSHCAFCPGVLDSLSKMIKSGELELLKVINLEQHPEAMQEYKVRSVPWVKIGKHELTGSQTIEALQQRVQWALDDQKLANENSNNADNVASNMAGNTGNLVADFDYLLSEGQADKVVDTIKKNKEAMQAIMKLLGDTGTVLSTRIGIGVVFEEFAGDQMLKSLIPELGKLSQHDDKRIRADAFHYLGMTADKSALTYLEAGKNDLDDVVKEIVMDSIEELEDD